MSLRFIAIIFSITIVTIFTIFTQCDSINQVLAATAENWNSLGPNSTNATLHDHRYKLEVVATGLNKPTNMAFLDNGDLLVLEKSNGMVKKIVDGKILPNPILDVNVANYDTRGMLGIALAKNESRGVQYVFLYYTNAGKGLSDGEDRCKSPSRCDIDSINQPSGNVLYRYELGKNGTELSNKKLLLNFSALPGATHNGGEIAVSPDNHIYVITGNAENTTTIVSNSKKSNVDGKAGILALDHDGEAAFRNGILGNKDPLNKYFAYGIRNGFGLDFDPVTGNLWDTENGPTYGDEINLVEPGFNSGYKHIMGFWKILDSDKTKLIKGVDNPDDAPLVTFKGKGKYSSPELAWNQTVAPTAIKFLNSDKYGKALENDIFVGSASGYLFHFDLNSKRTALILKGQLKDRIADDYAEQLTDNVFGDNFGVISDVAVGPDGYLYVVSMTEGQIFRIIPK